LSFNFEDGYCDGNAEVTKYYVEYSSPNGQPQVNELEAGEHQFTIDNLEPNTQYTVTVSAENEYGESRRARAVTAQTKNLLDEGGLPPAPKNLRFDFREVTRTSIKLTWE
jgi:uncharacterized alpha/beta hydrolase family protein